ncbi:collagenase [Thalassotalea ganghwensis]
MKINKKLLTLSTLLTVVYAGGAGAGESIRPDNVKSFEQFKSLTHVKPDYHKHISPPKIMSPKQYVEMQKLSLQHHNLEKHNVHSPTLNTSKFNRAKSVAVSSVQDAAQGCTATSELISLTGQELVEGIKAGNLSQCIYGFFDNALKGQPIFSDSNLITVVEAINDALVNYDAQDMQQTQELEKLIMYLRAMHWVEDGRTFSTAYMNGLKQAFDSYFAGEHFVEFTGATSRNFMIKYEMLILVNSSSTERQPYLKRFSEALLGYANSVSRVNGWGENYEEQSVSGLLTQLFNGNAYEQQATKEALLAEPEIINNLIKFVTTDGVWLIGHTREYQWTDTVGELGRMLMHGGIIAESVRPTIQTILSTYEFEGTGSNGWVRASNMVKEYDSANCELYGEACSFDLEAIILSNVHQCHASYSIRYQGEIAANDLATTCTILDEVENKFHNVFGTSPSEPVADDYNETLELVIFADSNEYKKYGSDFFPMSTDNGGMYLEGDPSVEGNQARFIAHQNTWAEEFDIWNLEHELIHYLDGRYNQWGDFNQSPLNLVWWGEGLAEYLSKPDDNSNALAVAPQKTYKLSELFQTTYANSNNARTYYWGYLAARFMMENHRNLIDNELLPTLRARKVADNSGGSQVSNEGCEFDWGWKAKPEAEENNWLWLYDDGPDYGYSGSGYWVWTCGQPNDGSQPEPEPETPEIPEFTPYDDILANWGTSMDDEFDQWLDCIVAGNGTCQQQTFRVEDIDQNGAVDKRDVNLFQGMLRNNENLGLEYDFNGDNQVNRRDVRAMTALCDITRCAIAQ